MPSYIVKKLAATIHQNDINITIEIVKEVLYVFFKIAHKNEL